MMGGTHEDKYNGWLHGVGRIQESICLALDGAGICMYGCFLSIPAKSIEMEKGMEDDVGYLP